MAIPLVVIGAGGFGRETLDVIEAMNRDRTEPIFELLGVVDSCPSEANIARLARRGVAYLGTETSWMDEGRHAQVLIGIGNPGLREVVAEKFGAAGFTAAIAIHPSASIGSSVTIGAGAVVCGGVQISTNVVIGNHVHVNPNVTVGHDSILRDFVSINPAAVVSGEVSIGRGSLVGAGAVVLQGIELAAGVLVGASACVTRNVSAGRIVKGVPAH